MKQSLKRRSSRQEGKDSGMAVRQDKNKYCGYEFEDQVLQTMKPIQSLIANKIKNVNYCRNEQQDQIVRTNEKIKRIADKKEDQVV